MADEATLPVRVSGRLGPPVYLRLPSDPFDGATVTLREHLPPDQPCSAHRNADDGPLVLVTFHPGYAAGSYADRDYFDYLSPYLFGAAEGHFRLRMFTINHPGYDRPIGHEVDRFQLQPFGIELQPAAITTVYHWLLENELAEEREIEILAYGHSMGGLALARADLNGILQAQVAAGRQVRVDKVLSAPALRLHAQVLATGRRLELLHRLKQTLGWAPLYHQVAGSLYELFAPILFRRTGRSFSLNPADDFYDFSQIDPFMLLEQGRQLLRLQISDTMAAALLDDVTLILADGDRMVDVVAIRAAAAWAQHLAIQQVDSTHLPERDAPELIVPILLRLLDAAGEYR